MVQEPNTFSARPALHTADLATAPTVEPRAEFSLSRALVCARACGAVYDFPTIETPLAHVRIVEEESGLLVAFRGTKGWRDILTDAQCYLRASDIGGIHLGFWAAATSIADEIRREVWTKGLGQRITFTGHSLGGAVAQLVALMLHGEIVRVATRRVFTPGVPVVMEPDRVHRVSATEVYTFGGPRVGDWEWARKYNKALGHQTWRLIDEEDIVPRIPPALWGYRHTGQEVFFPSWGRMKSPAPLWFKVGSDIVGTWIDATRGNLAQFADHGIGEYVARLEEEAAA